MVADVIIKHITKCKNLFFAIITAMDCNIYLFIMRCKSVPYHPTSCYRPSKLNEPPLLLPSATPPFCLWSRASYSVAPVCAIL